MTEPDIKKGLAGVVVDTTSISKVNPETNSLLYRGYPVQELAATQSFEAVAYLLWHGELPTPEELAAFRVEERRHRALADTVRAAIDLVPLDAHPMDEVRTAVSLIGASDPGAGGSVLDAGGSPESIAQRWRLLGDMGPALIAAFACSPRLQGVPRGDWASQRMRTWLELDSWRTVAVPEVQDYAGWALDVPLMCVRNEGDDWTAPRGATFGDWIDGALDAEIGRRPVWADLDYHLSTLFPPVRAVGHLEVRYIDAQPGDLCEHHHTESCPAQSPV